MSSNEAPPPFFAGGLPPAVGATASRVAVPVYHGDRQVGKATSTTWSPVLKRMIALATIDRALAAPGTAVDVDAGERVLQGAVMKRAALPVGSAAPNY